MIHKDGPPCPHCWDLVSSELRRQMEESGRRIAMELWARAASQQEAEDALAASHPTVKRAFDEMWRWLHEAAHLRLHIRQLEKALNL